MFDNGHLRGLIIILNNPEDGCNHEDELRRPHGKRSLLFQFFQTQTKMKLMRYKYVVHVIIIDGNIS